MEVVFVSTTPSAPADMPIPEDEQGTGEETETAQAPCAATRPRRLTMPNIRISSQEWKKQSINRKKCEKERIMQCMNQNSEIKQ